MSRLKVTASLETRQKNKAQKISNQISRMHNQKNIHNVVESSQTHNPQSTYLFKLCPLERTACRTQIVTEKNKHHIFAPTANTRCRIISKLCMVIEDVESIKKVAITFRSNVQFFLHSAWKNLG